MFNSVKKALRNLYDYGYKPTILIADAAPSITEGFQNAFGYNSSREYTRIMCWAHVRRNCDEYATKLINDVKIKDEVIWDIFINFK